MRLSIGIALILLLSGGGTSAAATPPLSGPLADIIAPGIVVSAAPHGLPVQFGFTAGGNPLAVARTSVQAPGWSGACLVTMTPEALRGDTLSGVISLQNNTGGPLFGLRLDLTGSDEEYRGADGRPAGSRRPKNASAVSPLFFGDLPAGADSEPVAFQFLGVDFVAETIHLSLRLSLSGYLLAETLTPGRDILLPPASSGEGLDVAPRPVHAGTLFETMGFTRCACQIDTIRAQGAHGDPLLAPRIKAGPAPGALNRLTGCDVGAGDHLFVLDREFAVADSTGRPLARASRFDDRGSFVTAWGWLRPGAAPPEGLPGRLVEPDGVAALSDGRVAVRLKPLPRHEIPILVYAPFVPEMPKIAPR